MRGNLFDNDACEAFNILDGELILYRNFLPIEYANNLFESCINEDGWGQDEIKIFGKTYLSPRLTKWYGDQAYEYSGLKHEAKPLPDYLMDLRMKVETQTGFDFNSVLINYYRNGDDGMGWHSDDEKELGMNPAIASYTIGAERRFSLKHKSKPLKPVNIVLPNNSLLLMSGQLQHHWKHALPKVRHLENPRLNFTFRKVLKLTK
ncbi:alpha-ketoglutarate-dependent dioxygenase AlkB family protein [Aureibacter tunicatorum]|uniref:Alkylated DNA repair dioxygenase AlkB n=1 Tax=Aureibacter tunicatorum TaxID=866807 RepID=A0AAE4BSI6_9BACT|nr:alpha-ketoglutarate-dependent dioxygenase AlkB [Aureibacter tunicatorum]MDR6239816.1 alkylated DNA repair dioxygenase AlkB [Aureibacter tunicatorum]BDD04291.1 alkylated DNA repair protein [Aureibacter tunicatorum]